MTDNAAVILTLMLDDASQAYFDTLRRKWFPANLNLIPAHVTIFHHLPGEHLPEIRQHLAELCAAQGPSNVLVTGVRSLGHGVAYSLAAPGIEKLRAQLATRWRDHLTAQDRQPWRPHVTVQNKVPAQQARDLMLLLSRGFEPFTAPATGLALWRYRDGPWDYEAALPFSG